MFIMDCNHNQIRESNFNNVVQPLLTGKIFNLSVKQNDLILNNLIAFFRFLSDYNGLCLLEKW